MKYAQHGAHFNRTTIEAMINGAVPVATDLGMYNSNLFKKDVNYIQVPYKSTPQEFADIVDNALQDKDKWEFIRHNNLNLLTKFDRKNVAQQYVDIATDHLDCSYGEHFPKHMEDAIKRSEYFN